MQDKRSPQLLDSIVNIQRTIVRTDDDDLLLEEICRLLAELPKHELVWVGTRTERTASQLLPRACAGGEQDALAHLHRAARQDDRKALPQISVLDNGQPSLIHQDGKAQLAVPLQHGEAILGLLCINADSDDAFEGTAFQSLVRLGTDIGHALDRLHQLKLHKFSDERIQFLLASSPVVIYSCEVTETFPCTFISENVGEMMGFEPSQFIDNPDFWASNIHPDDKERVFMHLPELFEHGHHTHEYRFRLNDDRYIWVRDEIRLIHDADGKPVQAVGSWADIQAEKAAEVHSSNLQHSLLLAQKLESVGHMTGGVAHDFNNILAAILGFADLMALAGDKLDEEKRAGYVEQIRKAGHRGRDLVRSMLTYARGVPVSPSATHLPGLLDDMMQMLRATIPSTVDIDIELQPDLPAISCDENHLRQIITNLCINAQAAMQDSGRLTIRARHAEVTPRHCTSCHSTFIGDFVEISIGDTGSGIDAEILPQIFDPFFSTKSFDKGTGMGLSIGHGLAHSNGGHIEVESAPGEGTCFHVHLPLASDSQLDEPGEEARASLSPELTNGVRVLVVDDEPSLCEMIRDMLSFAGCIVDSLSDSTEALARLTGAPDRYRLLITDQTMPQMSGSELIERLRADGLDLPILLYSGDQMKLDEDKARDIGANGFLPKPLSQQELLAQLQKLLTPAS